MRRPRISIIITSYNQLETLRLLFASLCRQTYLDFEVIVADDGSSDETSVFCRHWISFPVQFVTQDDKGYRKSRILNRALHRARGDYFIFLDADVILEKNFILDHYRLRRPGHFVCGRRVDLGPSVSRQISLLKVQAGKFDHLTFATFWSYVKKDTPSIKRGFRVSTPLLRRLLRYDRPLDILGSNFSIWKSDLIAVNGFNEKLESYWGEDGDLFVRLRNSGKKPIGAKGMCIQYHIFHQRRPVNEENKKRYQEQLRDFSYSWAPLGFKESRLLD